MLRRQELAKYFIPVMAAAPTPTIIGVEWNQSTDTWTRIDVDGNSYAWSAAEINAHATWGGMTRVNLAVAGTESAVYGGAGYAEDGTNGRVMVRVPQFWYKASSPSANVYRWWISDMATTGFAIHPAFYQRGGTAASNIYVGAYEADGYLDGATFKLHSRAGVTPVTGGVAYTNLPNAGRLTIDDAEDYANNIGSGWGCINIWSRSAVTLLAMVEWGNLDSQTVLGMGIVSKPAGVNFAGENTASFNVNTNLDATLTGAGDDGLAGEASDGLRPVTWRGIENLWGNAWSFVIGMNAIDAAYRVIKAAGLAAVTMNGELGAGEYDTSTAAPITSDGYISNIESEALLLPLLISSATAGASNTYIPDYQYSHDAGETNIVLLGGVWADGVLAGVAFLRLSDVASISGRGIGARCEFIS